MLETNNLSGPLGTPEEYPLPAQPLFSVIIPVRNEEKHIERCLRSLQRLQFAPRQFEVLVVDNGSTDRTVEIASSYEKKLPLRVLEKKDAYISAVRNTGAAVARGRYLAFLDADCEVPVHWLNRASQLVSDGLGGAFGSFYLIPDGSSWIARYWYGEREKKGSGEVSYLPSGDLFISSQIFNQVGGFNESIQTNEDFELCQRVRTAGFPITCVPELGVIHWGTPQTMAQFFRKNRWHGMHVFRVFLRNLPALYNLKAVAFAFYTLLCLAGILIGVIVGIQTGKFLLLGSLIIALLVPSLLLAAAVAASSRRPIAIVPLAALYFAYGVARASSLMEWQNWVDGIAGGTKNSDRIRRN